MYKFLDMFVILGREVNGKPLGTFPFLRFFPPYRKLYNEVYQGMGECRQFIKETISNHIDNLDDSNPRDFIDKFLIAGRENKALTQVICIDLLNISSVTQDALLFTCFDLFMAGSETTSKSLLWSVFLMVKHPEIQERVRDEIR